MVLAGKKPRIASDDIDILPRNVIRAYHDMYMVRAGIAYVDDESTFCFEDITVTDNSGGTLPKARNTRGYRVEGIKAIKFDLSTAANGNITGVTVYVLAEGDNAVTGRDTSSEAARAVRNNTRWTGVNFEPEVYYEEFQMQWRTRNIEAPGA
jgi:hypothetical protein